MTTTAPTTAQTYIHRDKPIWNSLAIAYTGICYVGGIALLLQPNGWLNGLGVFSLTHSLVLSAYLAHECMHGAIFASMKANAIAGGLILWLNGACYTPFHDLARLHIAHHVNRVDFCRFDLGGYLDSLPHLIRNSLLALEWLYFPALAFLLRIRSIFAPFWVAERKNDRGRVTLILIVRLAMFALLAFLSPKALLLYFLSYIGMITILRFMDAFQHTYEVFPLGAVLPDRDRAHEQTNTFSNVISQRYWWLNLLLLNFGYHNAHHEVMKCPWHSLHELDRALFSDPASHVITLPELLANYHKFRITRIASGQGSAVDQFGNRSLEAFYGGIEVSFLVLPA